MLLQRWSPDVSLIRVCGAQSWGAWQSSHGSCQHPKRKQALLLFHFYSTLLALWGASLKGQLFIYVVSLPYLTPKSVFFSPRDALCSEVEHGYEYIDA